MRKKNFKIKYKEIFIFLKYKYINFRIYFYLFQLIYRNE